MTVKTLSKSKFKEFTENLIKSERVVGVKKKDTKFAFGELKNADDLVMDYDVTVASPRALFQPAEEKLFDFTIGSKVEVKPTFDTKSFILLGVHTYDLKALNQMDKIWEDKNVDNHYFSRRKSATVVALEPTKASKWSFWASVDGTNVKGGFDLLLTDVGDRYVIEVGTEKGSNILSKYASGIENATDKDLKDRDAARSKLNGLCSSDRKIKVGAKDIPNTVRNNYEHSIWEKQAEKCYSCGSCNLVCPTCYCFDVKDNLELDITNGQRTRNWDGCLLDAFAKVGTGENFREHRKDRFRHRIFRKTVFVADKLGELACVGCGRCSSVCLPDITDPVKIVNDIC